MLSAAQLHPVSPVLTEHVRRRSIGGLIADQVFPPLNKEGAKTGQLMVMDDTHLIIPPDLDRVSGTESRKAGKAEPSYITYTCRRLAEQTSVGASELAEFVAHGGNAEVLIKSRINKIQDQIMLARERDLASKLNATANYESGYSTTLAAGVVWTASGGDPVGDIVTAIKAVQSAVEPNVFICDNLVWSELQRHSALLNLLKYTNGGMVTPEGFKSIFGLMPIIASARYNASGTISPVWEDGAIIAYVNPAAQGSDAESDMTLGRTVYGAMPSIVEWDDPSIDHQGGTVYEYETMFCHQFIGVDNATDGDSIAGYLIDNAI